MCTAEEFYEWVRMFADQPWGDYGEDLRAGMVCSTIAASVGMKNPKPEHFIPWLSTKPAGPPKTAEDWEAKRRKIEFLAKMGGVKFVKAETDAGA